MDPRIEHVPVMRPMLPLAARLLPYLERIDASRIYSNHGPLASEFEARIASLLGVPAQNFSSASSGTAALAGAILATAGRATSERPLAIVPAFTFVATAIAVEQCGFTPHLVDVNPANWKLDVATLDDRLLQRAGVVVPVAPFGVPVVQEPWAAFRAITGIHVVIDGAASFDRVVDAPGETIGEIPVALSFHATKSFSTAEGGGVVSTLDGLGDAITQALNFGFRGSRESRVASINGKLSEYHAAVGLAELDDWHAKRVRVDRVAAAYRKAAVEHGISDRLYVDPFVSGVYALLLAETADERVRVEAALATCGFGTRRWYGDGLHGHSYFAGAPSEPLPVTVDLAARMLGIPMASDLDADTIRDIVSTIAGAI